MSETPDEPILQIEERTKFFNYFLWAREGKLQCLKAVSWDEEDIEKYRAEECKNFSSDLWVEKVEACLFKFPIWLLEKFDASTETNSFEIFISEKLLVERLKAIKPEEKNGDEYPYTLYPIGEKTFVKEGMGELRHHHIDDWNLEPENLEPGPELAWWEFPYEFVRNDLSVFCTETTESLLFSWAAKRIGWGQLCFKRKIPKTDDFGEALEEIPYEMDTECMGRDFATAVMVDFVKRCSMKE